MSTDVVGHTAHLKRFVTAGMPTVSLFEGPPSVGKTTLALWLSKNVLRVPAADFLHVKHLDVDTAHALARWLQRSSATGDRRLALVYLGESGWTAQSILLDAIERIDRRTYVIFTSPGEISPPLASRSERFRFGLLSIAEVSEILKQRGFRADTADRLAAISGGQIQPALDALETNEAKLHIIGVIRAIRMKDAKTLSSFASRWSDTHTMLLTTFCMEAISGRPFLFTAEDAEALGRKLALQILTETRTELRPRLVVHSQLMNVLRGT